LPDSATDTRVHRPIIGFLTDFGLDGAAAVCRGVMLGICPEAHVIDVAHSIRKFAIRDGARVLAFALPYLPVGVHVGVVDPGVGTRRRPIAILAGRGDVLIGPDNGLLLPAADALGGVSAARMLTNRDLWLAATSTTFHGRDIFAPVAGHLAAGDAGFDAVGEELATDELVRLPEPEARVSPGRLESVVTYVDSFGNIRMAGGRDELRGAFGDPGDGTPLRVEIGAANVAAPIVEAARYATTFGAVPLGTSLVYLDSGGTLAMADNQGNVAERLGLEQDMAIVITSDADR
jgi:S-adenosylmethionine hydrolase